jgi:DnaJ-domain-containing protein 1
MRGSNRDQGHLNRGARGGSAAKLFMDEMLGVLESLNGRAEEIGTRLEQIKIRMRELWKEDKDGREAAAEASPPRMWKRPSQASEGRSRY